MEPPEEYEIITERLTLWTTLEQFEEGRATVQAEAEKRGVPAGVPPAMARRLKLNGQPMVRMEWIWDHPAVVAE